MEVSLLNPPQPGLREPLAYAPLGLCYLAAMILDEVDCRIDNLAGESDYSLDYADLFGITYPSACRREVGALVSYIRANYPSSIILIGGPHPTVLPRQVALELKPDYVIQGEAEHLLRSGLYSFRRRRRPEIIDAGLIQDLTALPLPARHLLSRETIINLTGIHGSSKPSTSMISSRGCPYRCRYCVSGHPMYTRYRFRSAQDVVEELMHLREDFGIEHVRFSDDCFTLNKRRVLRLSELMRGLDMTFICMTRADALDHEVALALREAGCTQVQLGMEYASPRMLELMDKRLRVEDFRRGFELLREVGIVVKALLMLGYPGEREEDREMTLRFLGEMKPELYNLAKFTPLPGSGFEWHGEAEFFYPDGDSDWLEYRERIEEAIG